MIILQSKKGFISILLSAAIAGVLAVGVSVLYTTISRNTSVNMDDKLQAMTLAKTEWEKMSQQSSSELSSKKDSMEQSYTVGDYNIKFVLGEKKRVKVGTQYTDAFMDSFVVVTKNENSLYTSRAMPLYANNYSRKDLFSILKHYVRNNSYNENSNTGNFSLNIAEDSNGKKSVEAYLEGEKISLYESKELLGPPDTGKKISISLPYTAPETGYIFIHQNGYERSRINAVTATGEHVTDVMDFTVPGMAWAPVTKGDYLTWVSRAPSMNMFYFMPCVKAST